MDQKLLRKTIFKLKYGKAVNILCYSLFVLIVIALVIAFNEWLLIRDEMLFNLK